VADRIKAKAASIDAVGDKVSIVLTFGAGADRQVVEHVYQGAKLLAFAEELVRQCKLGTVAASLKRG
jgi:hypothetical protein